MCGIFGFLPGENPRPASGEAGFFESIDVLTRIGSGPDGLRIHELSDAERATLLETVARAQAETYAWMERAAFLRALGDRGLQARLREAGASVAAWTERLEVLAGRAHLSSQRDWETLNRLVVGGKDIAWQLEKDLAGNFAPVLALLGEDPAAPPSVEPRALAHAWVLNLLLTSLNRLEVRGRDSAGIAVYARFPEAGDLETFLDGARGGVSLREEVERRSRIPSLAHGAIVRPATSGSTLLLVFKVASEVGRMGDNAGFLREAIALDPFFQAALRAPGVEIQCLAHTRWASNGIISLANCHPCDSAVVEKDGGRARGAGEVVAVLNGDVDNYQDLLEKHLGHKGLAVDAAITTDAKIIPVVVAHHYRETGDLKEAFRRAFAEFEGSMAIGVMAADRPGEFVFGQKGSGQGLFLGLMGTGVAVASEMYGLVEATPRYVKAEGERRDGGEVIHLAAGAEGVEVRLADGGAARPLPESRVRRAEITTRDINRGSHSHFFQKEIAESVESVRRTLRGKFEAAAGAVRFLLGREVLGEKLLEALRSGRVRRVLLTGQGTAAVAAEGIAHLLERALARARPAFDVQAMKATELSGHHLRDDMSDTLVVAVSQSGTTTDTNRTVDMAKERGAWVIGIVNRRNSDLVYKSHGVLYTSDGRDIEMSVASTKAFYAQNVAGQILALALASELGTLAPSEVAAAVAELEALPAAMARTLELDGEVERLALRFALKRRHWALVGTGAGKIAADEVRIKLSELCYKSIAIDFLEDKKHIDLSSEPLVLVCANALPAASASDVAKEVAIFKAHKSIPLVITDEGENRFDPYAAGVVKVPSAGALGYLLATMVGHLFGYHAAAAFDRHAERLRAIRAEALAALGGEKGGAVDLPPQLTERIVEMDNHLAAGDLDSGLNAGTATRLSRAFQVLLGRLPVDVYLRHHASVLDGVVAGLSEAILELSRPIDAIKHQAKTVTVGISRGEAPAAEGPLLATARGLGLPLGEVAETHRRFLAALEPLVSSVEGATLYRVEGLDPLGRPTDRSTIRVLKKIGSAAAIPSRSEEECPLSGTKWGVVKQGEIHVGYGKTDSRRIMIVPVIGERTEGHVLLYHLELAPRGRLDLRLKALRARPDHLERLRIAVTERNLPWADDLIGRIDNDTLFFAAADAAAEEILERSGVPGKAGI
jgi:glucosamine--fructose-6-phosphate aminotransferase (isomerizing)